MSKKLLPFHQLYQHISGFLWVADWKMMTQWQIDYFSRFSWR
ncbi:hypothetical protein [Enterococcus casseliflavus]|nr:hypothetical protein [Enterococcus casseliflavus]